MTKLCCGMVFTTKVAAGDVASWLQSHCEGQWDLHPTMIAGDGITKKIMILFERESDRSRFENDFSALPAECAA